ncbi:MAG: DUF1015 domain-containing protein [Candidatus Omnitrophica bacterium]|nr:DUF1015 domain-containing protein [Candidatus Omnitrophota bacterium]
MANIAPFKGTRYNQDKIKDFSKVVAPPYDVISKDEQDELYKMSEYNIVRMLFGKDLAGDNENENRYTRAKKYLKAWQEKAVLKKDTEPSIYINLQEFKLDGKIKRRIGFIALLKLEEFDTEKSSIYPHENTLAAPKEDRAKLIHSIEANLGPIFAIFEDPSRVIADLIKNEMKLKPIADIFDNHGVRNKFWRVSDKKILDKLCSYMKDKKLFIADGHHRYEVGLAFSKFKKGPKYGYILTYFTDLLGDGLVILPYHRIVGGLDKAILTGLENSLKKNFIVKPLKSKIALKAFLAKVAPTEARFVIYAAKKFTGLIFKDKKDLDVTIAKNLIIDPLGKIFIDFTKDLDYAIKEVNIGKFSFAILVNPVKITEIRDVAFRGSRMPQKSTYFYPKALTGLVINVF